MQAVSTKQKMAAFAGAALMLVSGMSQSAEAFNFSQNDMVLAIYGNDKEVLVNLSSLTPTGGPGPVGNMDQITGGPTFSFDLSSYLNAAGVLPGTGSLSNPVRYTIMGFRQDPNTFDTVFKAGSSFTAAQLGVQTASINYISAFDTFRGNTTDANTPNVVPGVNVALVNRLSAHSFTGNLGIGDLLGGGFTGGMASNLGSLLNVVMGDPFNSNIPLTPMGQALLSGNGLFQITGGQLAAVPVPAAVVLFATGMIGLAGIARRKIFGQSGNA